MGSNPLRCTKYNVTGVKKSSSNLEVVLGMGGNPIVKSSILLNIILIWEYNSVRRVQLLQG